MPRWAAGKKKIKAGIHSPDGPKQKKKKNQSRYPRPRWAWEKRLNTGIRGPDGPRNKGSLWIKSRYPWPRWAKEKKKKKKRIKAGIHSPDGQV